MKPAIFVLTILTCSALLLAQQTTKPAVVQNSSGKNSPNIANVNGDVVVPAKSAKSAEAAIPPVLTDAQKLAFFKAQAQLQAASMAVQQAQQEVQAKQTAFQAAVKKLEDACGKDFQPNIDAVGDPVCVAKPAAPAPKK